MAKTGTSGLASQAGLEDLKPYQVAILQWIAHGKHNEEIALLMNLPRPQTVQAHVQRIMDQTGTQTRAAAVAWALRRNLIK